MEVYHVIIDLLADGKEVDVIHLDLSKAFDKVPHNLLLCKLQQYGISGSTIKWFKSYLSDRHQRVALDGHYSDWLAVTSGVPQGSILGPLLFLVYINDMPSYIHHGSNLALFADDSKLYHPINTASSRTCLQADLDGLHKWSIDHGMSFNITKCKVLHMSKRRSRREPQQNYHLEGQVLSSVPMTYDLGVAVTDQLSWGTHIKELCAKANKVLGLVKRICGRDICDVQSRQVLYTTLVRPIVEYAAQLWSPYTATHRGLLEQIQRRATKFILNYPPREVTYVDRLTQLNLLPLETRREIQDLVLVFKFKNGLINTNFSPFLSPVAPHYRTRNFDPLNFKPLSSHRQDYYTNSFFPRSVNQWNTLPSVIKHSSSLHQFKNQLTDYYKSKLPNYRPP